MSISNHRITAIDIQREKSEEKKKYRNHPPWAENDGYGEVAVITWTLEGQLNTFDANVNTQRHE